ncbi:cell division protein PerM [Georgenia daeguensis]
MPATTDSRVPHVIDVPVMTPNRRLPEGWLRGLVGGVEAAVLSWLTVVVPAIAAYVATAAAPALGDADWQTAARTGTSLWLLAHGGSVSVAGGAVSLPPLGLTLLSLALVYGANRRMRLDSYGAGAFAVAGFVLAMLVASVTAGPGPQPAALLGGAVVAVLGVGAGVRRTGAATPAWWAGWWARVPGWVRGGLRAVAWALVGLVALSVAAVAVGTVVGWDRVRMVQDAYVLDPLGTILMTLAQLLYLPTVVVWALAWVAGPGFAVGSGTLFAPGEVLAAPLPAVPLLGALPSPEAPGPQWVVVAPAIVGVVVGVLLHRRLPQESLARAAGSAVVCALGAALVTAALVQAAAGAVGPGRMAHTGGEPAAVAAMVLAELGTAVLLTVVALHPRTAERLGAGARGARERMSEVAERRGARREEIEDDGARQDDGAREDDGTREVAVARVALAREDSSGPEGGAARVAAGAHAAVGEAAEHESHDASRAAESPEHLDEDVDGDRAEARSAASLPGWHAVSGAVRPPAAPEDPAKSEGKPRRGRRLGRWSGPTLSDWTEPGRD